MSVEPIKLIEPEDVKTKEELRLEAEIKRLEQIKRLEDEIQAIEREKAWLRKHWSIRYYQILPDGSTRGPHKKQTGFHGDPAQIRIVSGGNRTGKSTVGALESVAFALGYRPWLPKEDPNYKVNVKIPNKGLVVGESFQEQVRKVLIPKLIGDPENGIPGAIPTTELAGVKRNPQGVITTIHIKNGSQIFLQSYDQDLDLFESADYDWCIEENQRVLMASGVWREIKNIKQGDQIVTVSDNGRRKIGCVEAVHSNGVKPLMKITTRGGYSVTCTANHRLWSPGRGWIEAGDIRPGMKLSRPVFEPEGHDSLTPDECFWLGAMIGDGWTTGKSPCIAVANERFLEILRKRIYADHNLLHTQRYDYRIVQKGRKNRLTELLRRLGLWGKKAHDKFVPDEIFFQSKKNKIEFLKGIYATDGWASRHIGYASVSKRLVQDVQNLLASIGIMASIYYRPSKTKNWRDQWHLIIGQASEIISFCEQIVIPSKEEQTLKVLSRARNVRNLKSCRAQPGFGKSRTLVLNRRNVRQRQQRWTVKSIEPIPAAPTYDLSVSPEHSYICEGFRVHNCWLDEPCPRPIWVSVQRGMMDRRGRTWMTMTPLTCAWIYDELYSRKDVGLHYFDITDNVDYGLTQQAVDEFAANLTDDEKEARLHGKFFHLVGLVYKKFNKDIHLKKRERVLAPYGGKVPPHWGLWMHIDTHPRTPHHAVWIAVSPHQRKFVVGELKNSDSLNRVEPFCEAVKVYEKHILGRSGDSIVRLIDPIAKTNDPGRDDGKSMYDLFADYGVRCNAGSKNRDAGILLMQNHLDYDLEAGRFPSLFVFEDLEGVIKQIFHYQWDEFPLKTQQKQDAKQTPIKKDDHFIEGIHRILLDEPYCDMVDEDEVERAPVATGRNSVTGY